MIANTVILDVRRFEELIESERQYMELKQNDTDYVMCHGVFTTYNIKKRDKVLADMAEHILKLEAELREARTNKEEKRRWYQIL